MATLTRSGSPIFAKNSDRPAGECQPLLQADRLEHPPGERVRCQYVEIDQVARTFGFVGSRPYWLWGLEHGINERGVAIGNHTIFTRDPVAESGLLGMDLVRLGLERASSARAAVDVITELIARHGQGGSGYADTHWPYHNSFLIVDSGEAYLVEASARNWALRRADAGTSATNHATIGTDWEELSADCERHARDNGWWDGRGRFDFAAAYRDTTVAPPIISSARLRATRSALAQCAGRLDVAAFQRLMRDHNDSGEIYRPGLTPEDERYFGVCMHADPVGTTTASMVVEIVSATQRPRVCWVAFCNPCVAPYLPIFPDGRLPAQMELGGESADAGGAWWRFKALQRAVEADWAHNAATARDAWRTFERELASAVDGLLASDTLVDPTRRRSELTRFMEEMWTETERRARELLARLG